MAFKAEAGAAEEDLRKKAAGKREELDALMIVANDLGHVEGDATRALLVTKGGGAERYEGDKAGLAARILDELAGTGGGGA